MNQNLEKGSYYILENPHILNRIVLIEVRYTKQGDFILHKRFRNEEFAEYTCIKEPMLFDHRGIECFANIPASSPIYDYNNSFLLNNYKNRKMIGDGYELDYRFKLYENSAPNCVLEDRIFNYPILQHLGVNFTEIKGTKLMDLLHIIKDSDSSTKYPVYYQHKRKLETLFENACQVGGFPYKTITEYHNFVAKQNSIKQQQEIDTQRKNQQASEAARRILDRYRQ